MTLVIQLLLLVGVLVYGSVSLAVLWQRWTPALTAPRGLTIWRLLVVVGSVPAGVLARGLARGYLNTLTGVEPNNFPTALLVYTAGAMLVAWPALIAVAALGVSLVAGGVLPVRDMTRRLWHTDRGILGRTALPPREIQRDLTGYYVVGPMCIVVLGLGLAGVLRSPPAASLVRQGATVVLLATEFAYDRTCGVSSETRWVALLKDRKEYQKSYVLIANGPTPWEVHFELGHCLGEHGEELTD